MKNLSVDIFKRVSSSINKPEIILKEEDKTSSNDIMVYMNTWKNYNEYGADLSQYGINSIADGWMTPEQGLEFCEKYAEDEPFINDTDNCPIEVSEYDNAPSKLEELIRYNEFEDKTILKNAMETGMYNTVDEYIDVLERGDYIWFEGVSDDEELGRAWVDMVGFDGISNKENYFDRDSWKEEVYADERAYYMDENNIESDEEFEENYESDFEDYLDAIADELADSYDGRDESLFDYEALGRDLSFDFTYTSDGAIELY